MNLNQELEELKNKRQNQHEHIGLIIGTCNDYCPQYEFLDRLNRKDINKFEIKDAGNSIEYVLVKKYQRSAAGKTKAFCEDIRSLDALERTTTYLITLLHHKNDYNETKKLENLHELYKFIEDRLRAVRLDISVQSLCNVRTIQILQKIINFYAISNSLLYNYQDFEIHINNEQLKRTMTDLMQMYKTMNMKYEKHNEYCDYKMYDINTKKSEHSFDTKKTEENLFGNASTNAEYVSSNLNTSKTSGLNTGIILDNNSINSYYTLKNATECNIYYNYYFLININDPESFNSLECNELTKNLVIAYQQNNYHNFFQLFKKLDFISLSILLPHVQKLVINNVKLMKNNINDILNIQNVYKMFILSKKEIKSILSKEGIQIVYDGNEKMVNLREKNYNSKEAKIERCLCKEIERRIHNNFLLVFYGAVDKRIRNLVLYQFCKEMLRKFIDVKTNEKKNDEENNDKEEQDDKKRDKNNTKLTQNDSIINEKTAINHEDTKQNTYKFCNIADYNLYENTKQYENYPTNMTNSQEIQSKNIKISKDVFKIFLKRFLYVYLLNIQKNELLQKNVERTIKNLKRNTKGKKNVLLVTKNDEYKIYETLNSYYNLEVTKIDYNKYITTVKNRSYDIHLFYRCKPIKKGKNSKVLILYSDTLNDNLLDKIYNSKNLDEYCTEKRKDAVQYLLTYKNSGNSNVEKDIINLMYGI